jgi:hypothetical protein
MTIVLGIDIGVTGAIAAVDSRGSCVLHDLPAEEIPGNGRRKRRIDGRALMFLVRDMVPPGEVALAVFEDVHSMPDDNGPSGFSLGNFNSTRIDLGAEADVDHLTLEQSAAPHAQLTEALKQRMVAHVPSLRGISKQAGG